MHKQFIEDIQLLITCGRVKDASSSANFDLSQSFKTLPSFFPTNPPLPLTLPLSLLAKERQLIYSEYLYNSEGTMQTSPQKQQLPNLLKKLHIKRASLVFQKLVLFQEDSSSEGAVRHYDYDCEGIETLYAFFKKKLQSITMKAFNDIKVAPFLASRLTAAPDLKNLNGTTLRTNLNTTYTISEVSPIKAVGLCTIRSDKDNENRLMTSIVKEPSKKLNNLLSRIKAVNHTNLLETERMRTDSGPNRENASFYLANSRSRNISYAPEDINYYRYYQSQKSSIKNSRRQYILDKFNQIENSLCELRQEKQSQQPETSHSIMQEINNLRVKLGSRVRRSANP